MEKYQASIQRKKLADGRGIKLQQIDIVRSSVERHKIHSEEFQMAYRFLFGRSSVPKNQMKIRLLQFSGYLPPLPKGTYDEEKQEKEDERCETIMSTRAFKLRINEIRTLCDFFSVDLSSEGDKALLKEELIDRLCDFLGNPQESMVKEKTSLSSSAKKSRDTEVSSDPKDSKKRKGNPYSLIKNYKKGKIPSDGELRAWVMAYIVCVDLDTATVKEAISMASAKFGVNLKPKKVRIKELIGEVMVEEV